MAGDTLSGGVLALVWNAGPIAKLILLVLMTFSVVSWALTVFVNDSGRLGRF